MPTNAMLLLDRPIIKGMHICCFCILMQLLTHYDHVIVQSLIVHPVYNAERLIRAGFCFFVCLFACLFFCPRDLKVGFLSKTETGLRYVYGSNVVILLFLNQQSSHTVVLEDVRGRERGLVHRLNHLCSVLCSLFLTTYSQPALMFRRSKHPIHFVFLTSCCRKGESEKICRQ